MLKILYISLKTGFSISFPSITTRPVFAFSKVDVIFLAFCITSSDGVNTLFKIGICFGCIDPLPLKPSCFALIASSLFFYRNQYHLD